MKIDFSLERKMGQALKKFDMLADGDVVAVGMSGGKDSYALLDLLARRRKFIPVKYDVVGVHVDLGFSEEQTENIKKFCDERGVKCYFEKQTLEPEAGKAINCFYCSWMRRTYLFKFVGRLGIKKLALGHHMNDLVETVFLNLFYQSKFESFLPNTKFFKGEFNLIRPLIFCKNSEILKYAEAHNFPHDIHKCPFDIKSQRNEIREMIEKLEAKDPLIVNNIFSAWIKGI
jgi:tRNA 2-thiocytidine biosynthesis protein TtcA